VKAIPAAQLRMEPKRDFAHTLISKLSVIVGQCDLLIEKLPEDSEHIHRLLSIRDVAHSAAEDIRTCQRDLDSMMRVS
jgi:hypothetical protein